MNSRRFKKAITRITRLPRNRYLLLYLANKARHFWYKASGSNRVAFPSTIMLELTNHCNLACITCPREYDYGKAMDKGSMNPEVAMKIIDDVWPYVDSIGLTGMGETLMYKSIPGIVEYIRSKNSGIIISVSTNAQLPGFQESVKPLINRIDTIQVSMDGLGEVYETIRKKASFEVLDKNLKALSLACRNSKTDLMVNMVVTRDNYMQMPEMVRYAAENNIRYLDLTMFNVAAVTSEESDYYDFYRSAEFLSATGELEAEISKYSSVTVSRNFRTSQGFRNCPFPWTHFYICWNGFVAPCCAKPFPKELNFGNVSEGSLMEVLNSKGFRNFRKLWYENRTPEFCRKCHFVEPV